MTTLGKRLQLQIIPGVNPYEDSTALDTILFTDADKVRFQNGKLRKIGGWTRVLSNNFQRIYGAARNIFSTYDNSGNPITLIGTSYGLYAYQFGIFYNITPLQTTGTSLTNPFSTEYQTGNFTITTTVASPIVTLGIPNYFSNGEFIAISGMTGTINGIAGNSFNTTFPVNVLPNDSVQITLPSNATSSGTIAANFTWSGSYLYVNFPNHGLQIGDRIKITGSSNVDGVNSSYINIENIVSRIEDLNNFIIPIGVTATSSTTGGGSVTIYEQLSSGEIDEQSGYGYGAGNYGQDLYGFSSMQQNISGSGYGAGTYGYGVYGDNPSANQDIAIQPRIWSMDKFGSIIVLTPGDPESSTTPNLYQWSFSVNTAPVLISGAPNAVKWVYVSNNIIVTLGSQGILNQFYASGIADQTEWTPGPSNVSYKNTIEQSGPLISQAGTRAGDLIFSQNDIYQVQYVGPPVIWFINKIFSTDGILGPKARVEIEDAVFWMGHGDFYVFDGFSVNVLPNNTVKRYVYDNLNTEEGYKAFAFANVAYNEIWWFYPANNDSECNNYVIYNFKEHHWTTGTLNRSAGEEPTNVNQYPLMVQSLIERSVSLPNSISSNFFNLTTDPITTIASNSTITLSGYFDIALQIGDYIQINGATSVGGIDADAINKALVITSLTYGSDYGYGSGNYGQFDYGSDNYFPTVHITSIAVQTAVTAISSTSGGGSSVTVGTGIMTMNTNLTRLNPNQQIVVSGVLNSVGGIPASNINGLQTIRFESDGVIQFAVSGFSTSNQTDGGSFISISYFASDRLFEHEVGFDDYNPDYVPGLPGSMQEAPMLSYAQTNYLQAGEGDTTMFIYRIYPDLKVTGNMTLTINGKLYADSSNTFTRGPITIMPNTTKIDGAIRCRQRQYVIESNVIGGNFLLGRWYEEVKPSATR